ncbi:MAG: RNA polymerase-binding protein RbpA [Sporichthyaceae bacterium]
MSERALRGSRLGATSYETDRDVELAPRQVVSYSCTKEHTFFVPFSAEAEEIPLAWECRVCGGVALRTDGVTGEEKAVKPARTHWDMLMERRTREELEEILAERLAVLRAGGIKGYDPKRKSA